MNYLHKDQGVSQTSECSERILLPEWWDNVLIDDLIRNVTEKRRFNY